MEAEHQLVYMQRNKEIDWIFTTVYNVHPLATIRDRTLMNRPGGHIIWEVVLLPIFTFLKQPYSGASLK